VALTETEVNDLSSVELYDDNPNEEGEIVKRRVDLYKLEDWFNHHVGRAIINNLKINQKNFY